MPAHPPVAIESTPQTPIQIPAPSLIWKSYLLITWSLGIFLLGGCILLRLRHLQQGIGQGTSQLPKKFQQLLHETAKQLKLRRTPQVILSTKVICPAVFGLFRPKLLMPADSIDKLTENELRHHLMHELAHIKRGDLFFHAIYMLLQIAYWFNPLLWMVGRQLQHLREVCCDATVARILREKTVQYRETLLETARRLLAEPVEPGMGLLGLFEDSNRLLTRLQWLEKKTWKFRPLQIASVITVVILMLACILPMAQGKKKIGYSDAQVTQALKQLNINLNDKHSVELKYWEEGLDLDNHQKLQNGMTGGWPEGMDMDVTAELREGKRVKDFIAINLGRKTPGETVVHNRKILTLTADNPYDAAVELLARQDELLQSKAGMNGFHTNKKLGIVAILTDGISTNKPPSSKPQPRLVLFQIKNAGKQKVSLNYWSGKLPGVNDSLADNSANNTPSYGLGTLAFRIVPKQDELPEQEIKRYRNDLQKNGPTATQNRSDKYAWFELNDKLNIPCIVELYQGKSYLLLHNHTPHVMTPGQNWKLDDVHLSNTPSNLPAVGYKFNNAGADLFGKITGNHIKQSLAILVNGKVYSAPRIMTEIRSRGIITGRFDRQEALDIITAMVKGMMFRKDGPEADKKIKQLMEEWDWKSKKDPLDYEVLTNSRKVADTFLMALKNNDWDLARRMLNSGSSENKYLQYVPLFQECILDQVGIDSISIRSESATFVTNGLKQTDGGKRQLILEMTKKDNKWTISTIKLAPALSPNQSGMKAAQSTGLGTLSFRIVPDQKSLSKQEIKRYRDDLQKNGPTAAKKRSEKYAWFEAQNDIRTEGIMETYQNKLYLLLYNHMPHAMLPSQGWKLKNVSVATDQYGWPMVEFEFDAQGANLFGEITANHLQRSLAILVNSKVYSAPNIQSKITSRGIITGRFNRDEAINLITTMVQGMMFQSDGPAAQKKINQLVEEWDLKSKKAVVSDEIKADARKVADVLLKALKHNDWDTVRDIINTGHSKNEYKQYLPLLKKCTFEHVEIGSIHILTHSENAVSVTTNGLRQNDGENREMIIDMVKKSNQWIINKLQMIPIDILEQFDTKVALPVLLDVKRIYESFNSQLIINSKVAMDEFLTQIKIINQAHDQEVKGTAIEKINLTMTELIKLYRNGPPKEDSSQPKISLKSITDFGKKYEKLINKAIKQAIKKTTPSPSFKQKSPLTNEVRANAQKTAVAFLNALKNNDWDLVRSMLNSGSSENRYNQHVSLLQKCTFDQAEIDSISIHADKNAVVHTRGLKQANGGNLQMKLELVKKNNQWAISDLEMVTGKVSHRSDMIIAQSMLMELKKLFESVYGQMDTNPKAAVAAMDEFLTEIEKFEKNIKGSPVEQVFLMATDQVRQARAALNKGEVAKAKAIFEAMSKAGPGFEEVMKNAVEKDKTKTSTETITTNEVEPIRNLLAKWYQAVRKGDVVTSKRFYVSDYNHSDNDLIQSIAFFANDVSDWSFGLLNVQWYSSKARAISTVIEAKDPMRGPWFIGWQLRKEAGQWRISQIHLEKTELYNQFKDDFSQKYLGCQSWNATQASAKPSLQQKSQKMVAMLVMLGNMSASVDDALGKGDKDIALSLVEQINAQIPGTIAMAKGTPFEAICDMMKQQFDSCHQAIKKGELKKAQALIHALQGMGTQMRQMIEKPAIPAAGKSGPDPKKAAAMLDGLKAAYGAANVALMENNDPKATITALEALIPQMNQFEKLIAGTPDASSIVMGIKMVHQMHKALKDGNIQQARNIMKQLDQIGQYMENIIVKMGKPPADKPTVKPQADSQNQKKLYNMFMACGTLCQSISDSVKNGDKETALILCKQVDALFPEGLALAKNTDAESLFQALVAQFNVCHEAIKSGDLEKAGKLLDSLNTMGGNISTVIEKWNR
ncbi:MAG: hypothetical protein K9M57_00145 [Phycisphaerae bacterium]|nr:hypothetical protein [Phycisphaerae bacterium]